MTNQIVNANIRLLIQFIELIVQINEIKYIVTDLMPHISPSFVEFSNFLSNRSSNFMADRIF